jgi:hypothetical protein
MKQAYSLRKVSIVVLIAATLTLILVACTTMPATLQSTPQPEATAVEPTEVATEESATEEPATEEPTGDQATLILQFDDNRTVVRKVDFTAPISGLALLEQSDLDVATANFDWGTAVCSIEGVGCPADDCFCNDKDFWSYYSFQDDAWLSYPVGPAQSVLSTTGAVEGWRWGAGNIELSPPDRAEAAQKALTWLRAQQVITDGSYASSAAASVESLLAIAANHEDTSTWRPAPDAPSLLDFVLAHAAEYSQDGVSEAGKLAVALSGAEACWPDGALKPSDYYSPTLGALHSDAGPLAWGILGTLALDEPAPTDSVEYLINLALPDGGWEWSPGWGRDTNSTALALQALVAAGVPVTNSAIISGQTYLQSAQTEEGGFSYDPNASWGNVADSNSTAYSLQGLMAVGVNVRYSALQKPGGDAIDFLIARQGEDGALGWQTEQPAPNLGSTQQAIPALLGQSYPLRRAALEACE